MDLARADLQVVAWDSGCARLKELFKEEAKDPTKNVHWTNTIEMFGKDKMGQKKYYDLGKKCGHAADYLVTAKSLAQQAGILVSEAERFIHRWFQLHPEILLWHKRIAGQLAASREVRNAFGYRRFYFDRIEDCLPEAVAWIPQSTIALVINHALCNIAENLGFEVMGDMAVELLLQVHDSLLMQVLTAMLDEMIPKIREQALITIPYPDPLVIPVGFKVSDVSWGDVKDYKEAA